MCIYKYKYIKYVYEGNDDIYNIYIEIYTYKIYIWKQK